MARGRLERVKAWTVEHDVRSAVRRSARTCEDDGFMMLSSLMLFDDGWMMERFCS